MRGYEFLENHEFYATKREFEDYIVYVFRKKEGDEVKKGSIQVATTTNGEFDWYFSKEEIEPWFQELLEQSEKKSGQLFRIKKIIEGKIG